MADRLLLRLAADGGLTWLRQDSGARTPGTAVAGVPPASVLEAAAEIIVLVPSEDVLLMQAELRARNLAQLRQAVPFAIEDQLLSPVEDLHFALLERGDGAFGVGVVAKAKLSAWLARLHEAGIRPDAIVPEAFALPLAEGAASVLLEDDRATVRLGAWSAFACGADALDDWLVLALPGVARESLDLNDFRTRSPRPTSPLANDALAFLGAHLPKTPLNLLEGAFAARHRRARGARWWRIAAALAVAAGVLGFANLGLDVVQLSRASARMDTLSRDALRSAFPDIDAPELARLAPDELMRARLARMRPGESSKGLLQVLAQIAPVLGTTTRIQTRGMEYRNGILELALRAPDVAALDSVRERLAATPGLKAEVTVANPVADGVDGRIRISGGAP